MRNELPLIVHALLLAACTAAFVAGTFFPNRLRLWILRRHGGSSRVPTADPPWLRSNAYNLVVFAWGLGCGAGAAFLGYLLLRRLHLL